MSGHRLAAELCRAVREHGNDTVEWRKDRRRRLFFFRAGALVLVQSNLKSESPERVSERVPGLDAEALCSAVAQMRLYEALGETDGEVLVHPDAPPPEFEPLDAIALLWAAADRLAPLPAGAAPRVVPGQTSLLARIPVGAEVTRYLLELDGGRPLGDVIDFGPHDPDVIARAIALAWALGAVEDHGGAQTMVITGSVAPPTVPPAPPVVAPTPRVDLTVDDIAELIRDEVQGDRKPHPAAPQRAAAPQAAPPRPAPPVDPDPADDAHHFNKSNTTVTLGAPRSGDAAARSVDPMGARFGPALTRIRGAENHFAVLGTGWEDAPETHRRAYFGLAQRLHPDRYTADPANVQEVASELFDRVRAAWEALGDDARRAAYIAKEIHGELTDDEKAMARVRLILEAEADFKRGVADLQAGRLPAAHEIFARVVRAIPDEPEFAAYAGFTTFRLEHTRNEAAAAKGAALVEAALRANDKLDNVWVLHGVIQRTKGNEAAARGAFVSALKIRPTNPDAMREMKRVGRDLTPGTPAPGGGGFFSRLFGKK